MIPVSVCIDEPCRHSHTVSILGRGRDIRSNIPLRLKEFPRAKPEGTPEGGGVYLTVYPELSPNTYTP